MFRSLRKSLATIGASLVMLLVPMVAVPAIASAASTTDINGNLGCGTNLQVDTSNCDTTTTGGTSKIQTIITTAINLFSVVVGIVAVVMVIVGGFKYITSGGDSGAVGGAKNTIVYAVIGLIIVALAQFFVQFVLNKVTS